MSKFIKSIILTLGVCLLFFVGCSKSVANNTSSKTENSQSTTEDSSGNINSSSDNVDNNDEVSSENNIESTSNSSNDNSNKNQSVNSSLNGYNSQSTQNTEVSQDTESSENTQPDVKQGLTEEDYYMTIKEAKQRQQDYIDSINDPNVKQSIQTSYSAAITKSTELHIKYPEDTVIIDAALKRVLNDE